MKQQIESHVQKYEYLHLKITEKCVKKNWMDQNWNLLVKKIFKGCKTRSWAAYYFNYRLWNKVMIAKAHVVNNAKMWITLMALYIKVVAKLIVMFETSHVDML